jgi:endonuclease/exonuclease/phosphatase family metal-dependent hydrolase
VLVDFRAGGSTVRLVNTHLEAFSPEVAALQAADVVAVASPSAQATIVIGDVNLPPGSAGYANLVGSTGLSDAWTALHGTDPGLTCCWNRDLTSGAYSTRIDDVFTSAGVRPTSARRVNDVERTPGGLAPSDHAGVLVEITTAP